MLDVRARDGGARPPWPVRQAALAEILRAQRRALLDVAEAADEDARRVLLLAGHALMAGVGAVTEAALALAGEAEAGVVVTGPAEIDFLRGGGTAPEPARRSAGGAAPTRLRQARRIARIASWTSSWRLPGAVLAPWATAVTHNPLLRDMARTTPHSIGFAHADEILAAAARAAKVSSNAGHALADALTETLAARLSVHASVLADLGSRLERLIAARARSAIAAAHADLAALRDVSLPRRLWSGTGGNYAARALGLELLRRGGEVVRFDHGGSAAPLVDPEGMELIEFSVASRFVAPTERLATCLKSWIPKHWNCAIGHGDGDPMFRVPSARAPETPTSLSRPRVLYAPTVVPGFRKLPVPNIADRLYIDWQIDVAAALLAMPIQAILRPHPEGVFRGRPHPLADVAPLAAQPFEQLRDGADVFVFDNPASTTFWEAACTDRPIVYLDLGIARFAPDIAPILQARLRTVEVRFDASNRPVLDRAALAEAVTAPGRIDPTPLRQMFAGRA